MIAPGREFNSSDHERRLSTVMNKKPDIPRPPVDSRLYDHAYFLTECEGYEEFSDQTGLLSNRLLEVIQHVEISDRTQVLDVGCGRGEIVLASHRRGATAFGIDYSMAAIEIAHNYLQQSGVERRAAVFPADAKSLPFEANEFDLVFMLDIIEHLYPAELLQALREAHRVLRDKGLLLIHTAPNIWYYRWGYPPYRLLRRLQGQHLPRDPKDRFPHHHLVHVNEQSAVSLKQALKQAEFVSKVWVDQSQERMAPGDRRWVKSLARWVTRTPMLKYIFCGDIYAIAWKKSN